MADKKIDLSYSEALKEIEEIIASLSESNVDINKLPERVKRGAELIAYCREQLSASEESVNKLFE